MKKLIFFTALFASTALFISCRTIKSIPEEKTPNQIIQLGQNCSTNKDYKSAEFCYETVIDRYGTDPAIFVEAKYELGHTYLKQKKYDKAYTAFTEVLSLYDSFGAALPGSYKKLCNIGLSQIPEKKREELSK